MKYLLPRLLPALVLICAFTACGSPSAGITGVKMALTHIERAGDGSVQVTCRVDNPNVTAYVLAKTSHKLTLNGTLVGTLTNTAPEGIPAQSQVERSGVLTPVNPSAGAVIDQAVAQGSAAYRLDSTITVLLMDDETEKFVLTSSGTVPVTAK